MHVENEDSWTLLRYILSVGCSRSCRVQGKSVQASLHSERCTNKIIAHIFNVIIVLLNDVSFFLSVYFHSDLKTSAPLIFMWTFEL